MFVPFISQRASKSQRARRHGGDGMMGGAEGGVYRGMHGGHPGSSGNEGNSMPPYTFNMGDHMESARAYGRGGGNPMVIPPGQPFAGRIAGGGTRSQVYGTRQYGSGYPGMMGRGTAGRGFPFYFWPIVWGTTTGAGTAGYLHSTEYDRPDNNSRPGGPTMTAAFRSNNRQNCIFRILSDNFTVFELTKIVSNACGTLIQYSESIVALPYTDSTPLPEPEQVIQYYRASSVALSLDRYNDTAALEMEGTPDVPLPSNVDNELLACMNVTIGASVPLVGISLGSQLLAPSTCGLVGIAWVVWMILSLL
ncbi:hypothetical protein AX17_006552 [Amanita inopinata Kibby_2008]|nr:hypothetical protein AX17_006552 [Amanita inopinata Kibby_2008]